MLTVIGTVPLPEKIYMGEADFKGSSLKVDSTLIPVERGTGALIAAVLKVFAQFGDEKPYCLLAGDSLSGAGSSRLLEETVRFLPKSNCETVVLHYMFVMLKYGPLISDSLAKMPSKPYVIADAGGMYIAKAGGIANACDVFTPDHAELAFLADSKAAHPMYTKPEFLFYFDETLVRMAREAGNIPQTLVVKGKTDSIFTGESLSNQVNEPSIQAMEAIGGTGDTVTGILAALQHLKVKDGIYKSLVLNRLIGKKINCTPRTQINEFIKHLDLSLLREVGISL